MMNASISTEREKLPKALSQKRTNAHGHGPSVNRIINVQNNKRTSPFPHANSDPSHRSSQSSYDILEPLIKPRYPNHGLEINQLH